MSVTPRIRAPQTAAPGETVVLRTLVSHPMETGLRRGRDGAAIPRRIVHRFTCTFEGETVIDLDLDQAIAANPFIEFEAVVEQSGTFRFAWHDDDGSVYEAEHRIEVG